MGYEIEYGVNEEEHTLSIGLPYRGMFGGCIFVLDRYAYNCRPCLGVFSRSDGPVARLTKNLPEYHVGKSEAFIDENNCPGALDFLVENGFAEDLGRSEASGFCDYPLVRLNMDKILAYTSEENRKEWEEVTDEEVEDWDVY